MPIDPHTSLAASCSSSNRLEEVVPAPLSSSWLPMGRLLDLPAEDAILDVVAGHTIAWKPNRRLLASSRAYPVQSKA